MYLLILNFMHMFDLGEVNAFLILYKLSRISRNAGKWDLCFLGSQFSRQRYDGKSANLMSFPRKFYHSSFSPLKLTVVCFTDYKIDP